MYIQSFTYTVPMDGYDTLIVMFQGSVGSLHLMNYSMNENKKHHKKVSIRIVLI